jgi:hypothetical protein
MIHLPGAIAPDSFEPIMAGAIRVIISPMDSMEAELGS